MTETQLDQIYYAMLFIAIVPAIIISFIHEKKRNKLPEMANTKPYTWGYYLGWLTMIMGGECIFISLLSFALGNPGGAPLLIIGGIMMALGYGIIKRNGVAWVIFIIVSFNPLCWIINGIYAKNRWSEFKAKDGVQKNPATTTIPSPSKTSVSNNEIKNKICPECGIKSFWGKETSCYKCGYEIEENIPAPQIEKENTNSSEIRKIPKLPPPLPTQTVSKNDRAKDYSI